MKPIKRWTFVLNVLVLIAAVWAACIYHGQWRTMEDTMVNAQRAWLIQTSVRPGATIGVEDEELAVLNNVIHLKAKWVNIGQSPAREVRVWATDTPLLVNPGEECPTMLERPEWCDPIKQPRSVVSNHPHDAMIIPMELPDAERVIAELTNGQRKLCVAGRVEYLDVFDRPRWSAFCSYLKVKSPERCGDDSAFCGVFAPCARGDEVR